LWEEGKEKENKVKRKEKKRKEIPEQHKKTI